MNPLIILGSSRSDGHTMKAILTLTEDQRIPIINLQDKNISHYDYANLNHEDDFLPVAEYMLSHNPLILATPVYWDSMSGIMKTFLDRWSDLITIRKDLGRQLEGKDLYIIASYGGGGLPRGFEDPFIQTCDYLKMHYKKCFYYYSGFNESQMEANLTLSEEFKKELEF